MSLPLGVILAGGLATRMGGGDKCLRRIGGRRMIDHVIARLEPQCGGLALSANGDPARFSEFGLPVLPDTVPGREGPLAGVLAGLDWAVAAGAEAIVTAASDAPFLPVDLVVRLQGAAGPAGLSIAGSPDATGRIQPHPTFGLWPVALRHDLRAALAGGTRRMRDWTEAHGARMALFGSVPVDPFFNVNTPEDIATAERLLSGSQRGHGDP